MVMEPKLYFACSRCGSPNRAPSGQTMVMCHACLEVTPGPRSKRSQRLLSHASGETCPYFCSQSRARADRLCAHTSADLPALDEPKLRLGALLSVFAATGFATSLGIFCSLLWLL